MTRLAVDGLAVRDAVMTEVVRSDLHAICEEMAICVSRTARSVMVQAGDFAASVSDAEGRLIGPGYAAPIQNAHFAATLATMLARFGDDLHPGDVLISNDPYEGMGHLPDVAVVTPVFADGRRIGFTHVYSHHTDMGGRYPGGISSRPESIYEEGLRIPAVRYARGGRRNEALLNTIAANVRGPDVWLADLEAKVAGCQRGADELVRLVERHGADAYRSCCEYLIAASERDLREAIARIPDGRYEHEDHFEDDGTGRPGASLKLAVALVVDGDSIVADFAGTDPQIATAVNVPFAMTTAMVSAALKVLVPPETLLNAGFMAPITVRAPEGCLLNPVVPAAVGGRAPLAFLLFDLLLRTLAKAVPGLVPVPGEGGDLLHFVSADGERLALDTFFGGWGARSARDGIDGVAPLAFGAYGTSSAELLERETGIIVDEFAFVPDTEGAGRFRGSVAVTRTWRFQEAGSALVRRGRLNPSEGLAGGAAGAMPRTEVNPGPDGYSLPRQTHTHLDVKPGDRIRHQVAGTGGYGDPRQRDPEVVREEVRDGKLSVQRARDVYAVALREDGEIDRAGTAGLRGAPR